MQKAQIQCTQFIDAVILNKIIRKKYEITPFFACFKINYLATLIKV